jgi:hypothetical protein
MRKEDIDRYALRRPFEPFEVRMVDGHRYRFDRIEQFLVGRNALVTLDAKGLMVSLNIGLITSVGAPPRGTNRRRPRRRR